MSVTRITNDNVIDLTGSKVTGADQFAFNDNDVVNDMSTLALRQASNENKAAYNTSSMYIDVFQDSTGITGLTQTARNAAEYISSLSNATGSFTSNNITSSSAITSMGAVITYQDNAGTNALNTDIVMKLSADGGSNYATATLTAMPDFAAGIKMAKVNDLTVTAGTSLKYKLEFANQASGSKEARIRGVALQY